MTSQVAFALVLLVGAGLLLASFDRSAQDRSRIQRRRCIDRQPGVFPSPLQHDAAVRNVSGRILERIRAVPGVIAAGMTSTMPMAGQHSDSVIIAEGYQMAPGESLISPSQCMTAGYFEAMQTELRAGRLFDARDSRRRRRPRSSLTSSSRKFGRARILWGGIFPTTATT